MPIWMTLICLVWAALVVWFALYLLDEMFQKPKSKKKDSLRGRGCMLFLVVVLCAATSACGGGSTSTAPPPSGGGGNNVVAPAITTPPSNQTVTVGGTATFNVGASGTTPHYAWTFNGNAVGQDAASYTTDPAQPSENGAAVNVSVSNSAGVAQAGAALTVLSSGPSGSDSTPPVYVQQQGVVCGGPGNCQNFPTSGALPVVPLTANGGDSLLVIVFGSCLTGSGIANISNANGDNFQPVLQANGALNDVLLDVYLATNIAGGVSDISGALTSQSSCSSTGGVFVREYAGAPHGIDVSNTTIFDFTNSTGALSVQVVTNEPNETLVGLYAGDLPIAEGNGMADFSNPFLPLYQQHVLSAAPFAVEDVAAPTAGANSVAFYEGSNGPNYGGEIWALAIY